jgi:uncharacterized membrane protein
VDLLRGIIMVIMAIDHTRDFFTYPGLNPTNLAMTTPALFFTRWITHFCAPTFFLLTGTGAYLSRKNKSTGELSRFLVTRGAWLIFLELVVIRTTSYQLNFDYHVTILLILWALGWSMIALAGLVHLKPPVILAIGLVLIFGHNALDSLTIANPIWAILHVQSIIYNSGGRVVLVAYPLIPWIGVTAVGYYLGQVYDWEPERRRPFLLRAGLTATIGFVALRALNVYGDPSRWTTQNSPAMTMVSFFNTTKYPPSLLFLLMTLGPAIALLSLLDRGTPRVLRPAVTIGRVPLFYYALHFAVIHLAAVAVSWVKFGSPLPMLSSPDLANYPFTAPKGWGFPLATIYMVWALVVSSVYPACVWFADLKRRRRDWWLSYL